MHADGYEQGRSAEREAAKEHGDPKAGSLVNSRLGENLARSSWSLRVSCNTSNAERVELF